MKKPKVLFVCAGQWDRDFIGDEMGFYREAFDVSLCGAETFQETIETHCRDKNRFDVIVYMLGREHASAAAYADYESNMGYLHSAHQNTFGFDRSETGIVLWSTGDAEHTLYFAQELKRQTHFERVLVLEIPCSPKTAIGAISLLASGKPVEADCYLYESPTNKKLKPRKPCLYTPGCW